MKKYKAVITIACVAASVFATPPPTGWAEGTTAQENLKKLEKTNSCRGCDLSGLVISRLNLAGADLEGADCSKTRFILTNLSGANLKGANLRGASFGGSDLGEADLRGADLRGASLEGAYLADTRLEGEFVTARPYDEIGVGDVEKEVFVPNPEKPKKTPETREARVAASGGTEEVKQSPEKKTAVNGAAHAVSKPDAPAAKKAVPVGLAIVEPQEQSRAEAAKAPEKTAAAAPAADGVTRNISEKGKPAPVPPADIKGDDLAAGQRKKEDGESKEKRLTDKEKQDRLARLVHEEKCYGCDLSGLDLSGKDLKKVDLEKANLSGCNLERVILDHANLKGAILQNASLRMASLKNADLYKADLSGADLSGANVQGAKFDSAQLETTVGMETAKK